MANNLKVASINRSSIQKDQRIEELGKILRAKWEKRDAEKFEKKRLKNKK